MSPASIWRLKGFSLVLLLGILWPTGYLITCWSLLLLLSCSSSNLWSWVPLRLNVSCWFLLRVLMFSVLMDGFPAGKSLSCKGMGRVDGVPECFFIKGVVKKRSPTPLFAKWMTCQWNTVCQRGAWGSRSSPSTMSFRSCPQALRLGSRCSIHWARSLVLLCCVFITLKYETIAISTSLWTYKHKAIPELAKCVFKHSCSWIFSLSMLPPKYTACICDRLAVSVHRPEGISLMAHAAEVGRVAQTVVSVLVGWARRFTVAGLCLLCGLFFLPPSLPFPPFQPPNTR